MVYIVKKQVRNRGSNYLELRELEEYGNIKSTLAAAVQEAEEAVEQGECKRVILAVLGSFYIMQEVRQALGFKEPAELPVFNYTGGEQRK